MKRINLKDVEFHIPIRIDHQDRIDNLELLVEYLKHHFDTNIKIIESSERSVLGGSPIIEGIEYTWIFDEGELFHRTKLLNIMAKESKCPIIVNQDCDVLLNVNNYVEAANRIRNDKLDIVYPYDGRFMECSRSFVPRIKENMDVSWIKDIDCNLLHPQSVGGVIFENREKFVSVGKENPNFYSYGYEDNERFSRFLKMGLRVGRTEGFLIHVEHWRGKNSSPNNQCYQNNMNEFYKVNSMSKEELELYIKSWK